MVAGDDMRIMILGDTHMDRVHVNYAITTAEALNVEKVFVVGDFAFGEHFEIGIDFLDEVDRLARMANIVVYYLGGNHDNDALTLKTYNKPSDIDPEGFLIVRPRVRFAKRGHRWKWDGISFIALGGAYSTDKYRRLADEAHAADDLFDMICKYAPPSEIDIEAIRDNFAGTHWFPGEEMTDDELQAILDADGSHVDIMLTHDKPRASNPDYNRKDIPECHFNQDRIQRAVLKLQPYWLIHGHLHFRYHDVIRCGDDDFVTEVDGLDCNTKHARSIVDDTGRHKPSPVNSWLVIDTAIAWHRFTQEAMVRISTLGEDLSTEPDEW